MAMQCSWDKMDEKETLPTLWGTFAVFIVVYLFLRLHPLLQEFAGEGLRTLAIAYRELDDKYFEVWQEMLEDANAATTDRDERISGLYEDIERDLMVYIWKCVGLCSSIWLSHLAIADGYFSLSSLTL